MAVNLYKNGYGGKKYKSLIHRLVLITFKRKPKPYEQTRHLDGNKLNNHISNLEWGTELENYEDKLKHGTQCVSGYDYNYLINQAKEIRELYKTGKYNQSELAKKFNTSQGRISKIVNHKTYANI